MFCREQVARLSERVDDIRAAGGELVAVGNGTAPFAQAFVEELEAKGQKPTFPVVTDPTCQVYKDFDMTRVKRGHNMDMLKAGLRAYKNGHRQTRVRGDARQLGGVLVVDTSGKVVHAHIEKFAGDHADLNKVIEALGRIDGAGS